MALFAVTTFVVFHFGLERNAVDGELAAGRAVGDAAVRRDARASTGCSSPSTRRAASTAFLLAPVDRTALFVAKALALFALPRRRSSSSRCPPSRSCCSAPASTRDRLPELAGVLLLADVGIAVVGTLVARIAVQTRARDLIVPLLALPLLVPVVIAARAGDRAAASCRRAQRRSQAGGWRSSALYDLIFGLLAYAVFDFLLED